MQVVWGSGGLLSAAGSVQPIPAWPHVGLARPHLQADSQLRSWASWTQLSGTISPVILGVTNRQRVLCLERETHLERKVYDLEKEPESRRRYEGEAEEGCWMREVEARGPVKGQCWKVLGLWMWAREARWSAVPC